MKFGSITRRDFLNTAAMTGAASALGLHASTGKASASAVTPAARKTSFDEDWSFAKGDFSDAPSASFVESGWSKLNVPHDWSIAGPFSQNEPSGGSGGYAPTGIAWYRKEFHLDRQFAHKRLSILFDGVYQQSEVWINGQSLGMRPYGFISFGYDFTPWVHFGEQPNLLAVRVDNSLQPNSRWYTGSGIYRHVWLVVTDPLHIAEWGTAITTPEVQADRAVVEIVTRVENGSDAAAECELTTVLRNAAGESAATDTVQARIAAGGEFLFKQRLVVGNPALWSTKTPMLYTAHQSLSRQGTEVDSDSTHFGIRRIEFDVDRGFLLNGEHVKLNGVCLHGDGGAVGTAVPERVWERRLELLKEMGCNAIRCSHNPPAPEFLDLCDGLGFLVMDEAFDEWREPKGQTPQYGYHKYFDEWAERDVLAMIARDRNHPSIVIWSAGNEVPDQTAPRGPETARKLVDLFHATDPTRLVTVACDQIAAEPKQAAQEFLDTLDVVGYNYADRWRDRREKYYSIDRHDFPRRRLIGTETEAMRDVRGVYRIGPSAAVFGQFASNVSLEVEQMQKFIQTYDYVSGDFFWTGIDYLGEARWPSRVATSGVLDTCGFRKDAYYLYQSLWTSTPMLHLFPHWNWKGHEGEIVQVTCYTNCDTVELFLNGKSFGVKGYEFPRVGMAGRYGNYPARARVVQTTADLHLSWDVPYEAGTLRAVGTRDGQVAQTVEVSTTGDPAAIRMTADRGAIDMSWRDVAHVTVEVVDRQGRVVPDAANGIAFSLDGPGRIVGVDNGRPDSSESYQGNQREAFNGLALVLLQAAESPGTMRLTASSASLGGATIAVTTRAGT
jgi:beta-galactosidase